MKKLHSEINKMNLAALPYRIRQFAPLVLVLISAALAVAAYLQALHFPFVSDDKDYLADNIKLADLHLSELWRLFTEPYSSFYEFLPLRELSFWLDMTLFGLNPAVFRLHNILLYLLCLPLVYATTLQLWRYFRTADAASAPWAAAIVTALFALHPALVESVVWVSGRKYVLPNLFSMLALWFAVNARREQGLSAPYAAAAVVAFAAVMLMKSSYVTVALVIALLWIMFWRDIPATGRRCSQLLWPLAIVLVAVLQLVIFIAASGGADVTGMPLYSGVEALLTRTLSILGVLFRLAVSPGSRHFLYPVLEDPYLPAMVILGVAVMAAAVAGMAMALRKRSLEGFAIAVFFLLCLPYIQLIPVVGPSLVQDRYLSIAVWPVMLLLVALVWRLNLMSRAALLLVFALPLGCQTVERPRDWRSFETLLDADIRAYPGYYMPAVYKIISIQLPQWLHREAIETANGITDPELRGGMIKMIEADHAVTVSAMAAAEPQEAMNLLWQLGRDLEQPPVRAQWSPLINLIWEKEIDVLADEWNLLIKHFPDNASVRYNAGLWMLKVHNEDAVVNLRAAIELQRLPGSVRGTAFKNFGLSLLYSGQAVAAEAPLRAALEQSPPDFRAYCLLAEVYKQTGRVGDAARAEAECLRRVPNEETAQ